jgi:hypothetical protein
MLAEQINVVHWVCDLGRDSLWGGQHFLTEEFPRISRIATPTRLAVEAGEMELQTEMLLPLLNPVEVAEHLASQGVVAGGLLIVGAHRPEAGKRFFTNVRILLLLLSGEHTDADLLWSILSGATLSVRPPRKPAL